MIQDNTKIIAIVSGVSLLCSIILYSVSLGVISNQKEQHLSYVKESAEAQAHKESLQKLMDTLDETKTERESLFTRFVQDEEVIDLLALTETIGKERGVELTTKSLDVVSVNDYFEFLIMRVEIIGLYNQVIRTLALLERLPYQTTINSVQIQRNEGGTWRGMLEVQVTKFKKYED